MSTVELSHPADAVRPYASRVSVLPFDCAGGTPGDERLARGFWEDIIIELARFPALGIIAARSVSADLAATATGQDGPGPPVDYVVSGSLGRAGGVIRVRAQLVDARTRRQIWAERYDRPEEEVFAILDEITARVANALNARIEQQNLALARRRSIGALAAYEAWLRGFDLLRQGTVAADEEARRFFERALEIDPQFARGYAGLSLSYFNEWSCSAWERWGETERRSFEFAEQAEALDPKDQVVQIILGRIQQYRRRFETAEQHFQRALALAPNDAEALIQLGTYFALQGQAGLGVQLAERSLDLNPLCPYWQYPYAALPRFMARDYPGALAWLQKAPLSLMVDLPAYGAAAAAYLDRAELAGSLLAQFDRQFRERIVPEREPDDDEQELWLRHVNPFRQDADAEHLIEGVRLARSLHAERPTTNSPVPPPRSESDGMAAIPPRMNARRLLAWPIANTFRKEGALWVVCFEQRAVHVPELKGFRDVACLLARPNEDVHCLTLAGRDDAGAAGGGDLLDERARREYQAQIRELRAEVAEAGDANDPGRAARAQEELDMLLAALSHATGIRGRSRKLGDPAERARTAVTWRIRKAVKTLADHHPILGRHLSHSLQTGVFCRYSPEKPVAWEV